MDIIRLPMIRFKMRCLAAYVLLPESIANVEIEIQIVDTLQFLQTRVNAWEDQRLRIGESGIT